MYEKGFTHSKLKMGYKEMRRRTRFVFTGLFPILILAFLLLTSQLSPYLSYAAGDVAQGRNSIGPASDLLGENPALPLGALGSGALTARITNDVPYVTPSQIALKIAEIDFENRNGGEELSTEEAYRALLHVSTTQSELEQRADLGKGSLAPDIQEEIIEEVARVATSEADVSSQVASEIIAEVLGKHGIEYRAVDESSTVQTGNDSQVLQVSAVDPRGNDIVIPNENIHFRVGSVVMVIDPLRSFTPGLYEATIRIYNPITGEVEEFKQDFAWGVLAMNTDQDVYRPGETADIHVGVLDDEGEIVGDADVVLQVVSPDGSTQNLVVPPTGTCGVKEVGFIEPDYRAAYTFGQAGEYRLTLTAKHANGTR